jgi:hypothetical protein
MSSMSESRWWNPYQKEVKKCGSTTRLRHLQFQNPAKKRHLRMNLVAEWFVFWGDAWGFLKEGVKTHRMAPISPLNSPTFFLSLHLLSIL